jgi:hypothetical protein
MVNNFSLKLKLQVLGTNVTSVTVGEGAGSVVLTIEEEYIFKKQL